VNKLPKHLLFLGLLAIGFILLFLKLALWQISRSEEKQQILNKIASLDSSAQTISADNIPQIDTNSEYTKISLQGHFDDPRTLFLAHQYFDHQYGYHVITPFVLQKNAAILIDRGWIKEPKNFVVKNNTLEIAVTGVLKNSTRQYIMGDNVSKTANYTQIQVLDTLELQKLNMMPYQIASKHLKLLSPAAQGYILDWHWTNMTPQKHYAYAIQWLLLAITVILLYSCLCYKTYQSLK